MAKNIKFEPNNQYIAGVLKSGTDTRDAHFIQNPKTKSFFGDDMIVMGINDVQSYYRQNPHNFPLKKDVTIYCRDSENEGELHFVATAQCMPRNNSLMHTRGNYPVHYQQNYLGDNAEKALDLVNANKTQMAEKIKQQEQDIKALIQENQDLRIKNKEYEINQSNIEKILDGHDPYAVVKFWKDYNGDPQRLADEAGHTRKTEALKKFYEVLGTSAERIIDNMLNSSNSQTQQTGNRLMNGLMDKLGFDKVEPEPEPDSYTEEDPEKLDTNNEE